MGLERVAAVMLNLQNQQMVSNYDTDLFTPLIDKADCVGPSIFGR